MRLITRFYGICIFANSMKCFHTREGGKEAGRQGGKEGGGREGGILHYPTGSKGWALIHR